MGKAILDIGGATPVAGRSDAPLGLPEDALAFDTSAPCCMGTVLGGVRGSLVHGGPSEKIGCEPLVGECL